MRSIRMVGALVLALVGVGCAHTTAGPSSGEQAKVAFENGYESVKTGAKDVEHQAGYVIERAENGVVRVARDVPMGGVGRDVSDAWITTQVKGKLAGDPATSARDVHVRTDAGMVTLSGVVKSRGAAAQAIRDALDIDGVTAVDSRLQYPTSQASSKIYEK